MDESEYNSVELENGNIIYYPKEGNTEVSIPTPEEQAEMARVIGLPDDLVGMLEPIAAPKPIWIKVWDSINKKWEQVKLFNHL